MDYQSEKIDLAYDKRKTTRKLLDMIREQKGWLTAWLLILIFGTGLDVATAKLVQYFVNTILAEPDKNLLWQGAKSVVWMVVTLFILMGIQKGAEVLSTTRIGQRLIMSLRELIFNHLQELSLDFFESRRTGHIMSWVTTDVLRIREFAGKQIAQLVKNPVSIIAFLCLMLYTNWKLTVVGLLIMPLIVVIVQFGAKRIRHASAQLQESLANVSGELQEGISAIQVVRSFANEAYEKLKFGKVNLSAYKTEMRRAKIEAIMVPQLYLVGSTGLAALMLYGVFQMTEGVLDKGDFGMIIYLLYATNDVSVKLGRAYMGYQDTLAASDRIFAFLQIQPTIEDKPDAIELANCEGRVELRNVSFHYADADYVLNDINLVAVPGKVIGIAGPSGGGKSTLAKLIPRFYDTTDGEILVEGYDVRDLTRKSLRRHLAIVPQETVLFHGTIRENIAYGKLDASDDEIMSAAKAANANEFIKALEHGYDTIVGERGVKLSGGQRQRISIARALLKDPKILILDEATSNLDTESEKLVQAALEKLMVGRTTFVIAHRLSTIKNADEIIVLKAGRIVQRGTHDHLLNETGVYRELYVVEEMEFEKESV
ncbi:MAG TPA: ABC transporter ATP-binding protein [bacterium]